MTGLIDLRPERPWGIVVWIVLWAVVGFGCQEEGSNSSAVPSEQGTLQLALEWRTDTYPGVVIQASPSGDVCVDYQISSIHVRVLDSSPQVVATADNVPCSDHGVVLDDIAPGSGYSVAVEGVVGDTVQWRGDAGGISVVAGQTSQIVHVEMLYNGDPVPAPTASITPADGAENIATETTIVIQFNEDVVPASVNTDSITLTHDSTRVLGTISYDSDTFQAVFTPTEPLAVATTYTVTVTTAITDRFGQTMETEVVSEFTTTTVWYVDGDLAASGSGLSWAEAFQTIQAAINAAGNGDQIWVKNGTYIQNNQTSIDKPVHIYGGFAGDEDQLAHRDPTGNVTIVDGGNSGYRCFYVSSPATIDGLTITGGTVTNESAPRGGAMYISNCSPVISNCVFTDNTVGPSDGYGGAVYIVSGNPRISYCLFERNTSNAGLEGYGGALYNDQGGPLISHCQFIDNITSGGYGNDGGAVFNNRATGATVYSDCHFAANMASGEVATGGAMYNSNSDGIVIRRCRFYRNTAFGGYSSSYGGAIYNINSDLSIENCVFYSNRSVGRSTSYGGAIHNWGGIVTINQCALFGNEASVFEAIEGAYGGAIANRLENSTTISNSILWGNQAAADAQLYTYDSSTTTVTYCDIDQSGFTGDGNQRSDPRLTADLHLMAGSPCIDSGDTSVATADDMDGEARPQGGVADIGADEFHDSDGNQLPDYWESYYGVAEPGQDDDNDLIPNLSEYHLSTDPNIAQTVSPAGLRGAFRNDGLHTEGDLWAPIGYVTSNTYRAFFIFDVSGLADDIDSAALRLELVAYNSNTVPETFTIYDVETASADLASTASGQSGVDIFTDLGSGNSYGQFAPTPSDSGMVLDIILNLDAIADINAARAGAGEFTVGLRLESAYAGHLLFSTAGEARTHQLVITGVE